MNSDPSSYKRVRIFWDIDGTLIRTNGAAALPFKNAIMNYLGSSIEFDRKKLSGFTDYEIIQFVFANLNKEIEISEIDKILSDYSSNLPVNLELGKSKQINEISKVLLELENSNEYENAIATGNCYLGAITKLTHVELINFFKPELLFHASPRNTSRDQIIAFAKKSLDVGQSGIIIGDSPKDILSAKINGLPVLAVASGQHTVEELKCFEPEQVLKSSWGTEDLLKSIQNISQSF
jgi:phosphoglycolate phosphatase-like HAD superfamily hydrolase